MNTPSQIPEGQIQIQDRAGECLIPYAGLRAFHMDGNLAMLGMTFQGIKGALCLLSQRSAVDRHDIQVLSGHPGTGVRDAFEYVTRAVTRGAYQLDKGIQRARVNPNADFAYAYTLNLGSQQLEMDLREQALPERFYTLFGMMRQGALDEVTRAEFDLLKRRIESDALHTDPNALFEYRWA